jgi:hypothetical protein
VRSFSLARAFASLSAASGPTSMAPALQFTSAVRTALELAYEYRHLMGKCQSAHGLSMEEALTLDGIAALFASDAGAEARGDSIDALSVTLRGQSGRTSDAVRLARVDVDQLEVSGCPWIDVGERVELVIEDAELRLSYRFKARVAWAREQTSAGFLVGLDLLGVPVLVRRGPPSVPVERAKAKGMRRAASASRVAA